MGNTYLHNCMMDRHMMLKFGWLFDLAKYLEHTQKFQCMGYSRRLVAPHEILGHTIYLKN